jgi:C-terminal processing protease CtpA/Prc
MAIIVSALAVLSSPVVFAQANDADAAAARRESELAAARLQQEAEASRAIESQVVSARREMEAARAELERAARQVVIRTQPVVVDGNGQGQFVFIDENGTRRFGDAAGVTRWAPFAGQGARAQLGAMLVDADGGALVTEVADGSGAADAGLKVGDVIQSIDGIDLADGSGSPYSEVTTRLAAIEPGATVQLVVERGGAEVDVDVETEAGSGFSLARARTRR